MIVTMHYFLCYDKIPSLKAAQKRRRLFFFCEILSFRQYKQ